MFKSIIVLLIISIPLFSTGQKDNYRVVTKKSGTFYTSEILDLDGKMSFTDSNGNSLTIKTKDILDIRKEIEGWDYFQWTASEFTDYVVVKIDSISHKELYQYCINWIKNTYKNPDEVIKTTIENTKVRIEGFQPRALKYAGLSVVDIDANYTIEIAFKDGRYKFDPISLSYRLAEPIGIVQVPISNPSEIYNSNGKLFGFYKYMPPSIEALFNNLNIELYRYIISKKLNISNEDDW